MAAMVFVFAAEAEVTCIGRFTVEAEVACSGSDCNGGRGKVGLFLWQRWRWQAWMVLFGVAEAVVMYGNVIVCGRGVGGLWRFFAGGRDDMR